MANPGSSPAPWCWSRLTDRLGAWGAALCALHCAALPFLLAALPGLGLGLLADDRFESAFTLFATTLALASLGWGYRQHHRWGAWGWLLPGLLALWVGAFYPPVHAAPIPHAVAMVGGGGLVGAAHWCNQYLLHGRRHGAGCRH